MQHDVNGAPSAGNAENFSLDDFFVSSGATLLERTKPFSDYVRASRADGTLLVCRELMGATGPRVRVVDPMDGREREMIMLGSNNYLGLADHPHVKARVHAAVEAYGCGVGGPPLLSGMTRLHRELEEALAALKGTEDALLFGSGFQTNLGWVTGLLRPGDALVYDELNHASLYDALKLSGRPEVIERRRFAHNDTEHLARQLEQARGPDAPRGRQVFVVVEGVYSMDGDLAPLPEIRRLCDVYGATLAVDDAHGTGVMGAHGRGTAEHFGLEGRIDIAMGTFSKAFATTGGFIAARREVVDYLRFFARSYMFSAHLPPTTVAAVLGGLEVMRDEPERLRALHDNAEHLARGLVAQGWSARREAAIIPLRIPEHVDIRRLARRFHEAGLFLNSVEHPAVPRSEQRLRVSVMATHTRADLDEALAIFARLAPEAR